LDHLRVVTMADVVARYKRAAGFTVLHPADGGISAAATAPLRSLGLSLDWGQAAHSTAVAGEPLNRDPGDIIDSYGADAVRWFVLSDTPPDRDLVWTENGLLGAWRFVHRLWRLINDAQKFSDGTPAVRPAALPEPALNVRRIAHRALAQVSANIDRLRFNVAVARVYAFARALETAVADTSTPAGPDLKFAAREAAEILVQLFHPMMPHLAEECWAALGHETLLATRNWPAFEVGLLVDDTVTLAVHVNGRKRADVTVARNAGNGDIEASVFALDAVRRVLGGKTPRKVVIVPQRIINVVA
jgi:leucyl-tRNA synthetase